MARAESSGSVVDTVAYAELERLLSKFKYCMSSKRWAEFCRWAACVFVSPQIANVASESEEDGSALFWQKLAHQATFGDLGGKTGGKFKFGHRSDGYDSEDKTD